MYMILYTLFSQNYLRVVSMIIIIVLVVFLVQMFKMTRYVHFTVHMFDLHNFYHIGYCMMWRTINTALCDVRVDCCESAFSNDVKNMAWVY